MEPQKDVPQNLPNRPVNQAENTAVSPQIRNLAHQQEAPQEEEKSNKFVDGVESAADWVSDAIEAVKSWGILAIGVVGLIYTVASGNWNILWPSLALVGIGLWLVF
ncbi:MAG: hypothetical protein Q4C71_01915 [Microbacteriaceae bacterium]|nr:hypothetical protein [Microbacteriaceae bacterium]